MIGILISTVIPVYNVEKYIKKCLESLHKQKSGNVEFIMIDDGSTDNSGQICDEYVLKDKRFRVIHTKNHGVAQARNIGMNAAEGDYIASVDPDDYVADRWLSEITKYITQKNPDILLFDYFIVNNDNIIPQIMGYDDTLSQTDFLYELSKNDKIKSFLPCKIIKRDIIRDSLFDTKLSYCEDYDFVTKISVFAKKISYLPVCLYYYNQRKNGITHTITIKDSIIGIRLISERNALFSHLGYKIFRYGNLNNYFLFIEQYLCCGRPKAYRKYYKSIQKNTRKNILHILWCNEISKKNKIKAISIVLHLYFLLRYFLNNSTVWRVRKLLK